MILVRSPLRITLGGGGTDLPSFSRTYGGFCLAAAIDRYVYVAVTKPFEPGIYLKYSQQEKVSAIDEVKHPIIRECLRWTHTPPQIEITTLADIPAGTGLGSSSSFTTALLVALYMQQGLRMHHGDIAHAACEIEIKKLAQTIGKQDQYIASHGGISAFHFGVNGDVDVEAVKLSETHRAHLEDHLLLFFTGYARESAADLLREQDAKTTAKDESIIRELTAAKYCAELTREHLERGEFEKFAEYLRVRRSKPMAGVVRHWLDAGESTGASGKLVGAGEHGFLLFYTETPTLLRAMMRQFDLPEVRFRFDFEGTKVLLA